MELIIKVLNDSEVESTKVGTQASVRGKLTIFPLQMDTVYFFQDMLVRGNLDKRDHLELLGKHLYNVLIDKDITVHYQECLKDAKRNGEKLKVKLTFTENAGDLANLPWEYLYYPGSETEEGTFLATEVELTLSRFIPLKNPPTSHPEDQPLKVLLVTSEPDGLGSKTPASARKVFDELKKRIKVDCLDKPTKDNLENQIKEKLPHVVHFVGSGRVERRTGRCDVALLDDDEKSLFWCPAKLFADMVGSKGVRVVFLELTVREGDSKEFHPEVYRESFTGIAEHLVKANIQAVVAMQFPVPDDVATRFVKIFYETLASGETVDTAVQSGRRVMPRTANYYDTGVFGTPMLFNYRDDNIVNPEQAKATVTYQVEGTGKKAVEKKASDEQPVQKKPIDLVNLGIKMNKEAGLSEEQAKILGQMYNKLFEAPGDMKKVLLDEMPKSDVNIQTILLAMIRELEGS